MSQTIAITRYRGDTFRLRITFTDADTGLPIDLTDSTLVLTVNEEERPDDSMEELFFIDGEIVAPATDGVCDFTPTETEADNLGGFYYDVQITDSAGSVRTVLNGPFTFLQDITKTDEEFIWTPSDTPTDGDPVTMDGTEFWKQLTHYASDAWSYETRDTRRVIRWAMDMTESTWQGRDLMALGPESPRPLNMWYPGWEFQATIYCNLTRAALLLVSAGYADYVDLVVNNQSGTLSAGWAAFVEGTSEDNSGPTDDASWPDPDWYVIGLRVDADGVPWGILHPESGVLGVRTWAKIMPDGWTWNPVVPFSIQIGAVDVDPDDPASVLDLWKYEWRRL